MREAFIISTGQIVNGRTAGSRRMMNIARALANGGVTVFLCSLNQISKHPVLPSEIYPGIYNLESDGSKGRREPAICGFIKSVNGFMKTRDTEKVIYLYPTVFTFKDWTYLFYFKLIKGYRIFCDINELRSSNAFTATPPEGFISLIFFLVKSARDFIAFKLSELQVLFYDGIVVISSGLEDYYSRMARKIVKVPILCDAERIRKPEKELKLEDSPFKICFAGMINCEKEGFNILFKALSGVNHSKEVELYLYGVLNENDKTKLYTLLKIYHLQNKVFYLGNVDPDELLAEFSKYHLLILPRPLNPQTKYGFSTKLSEYLISGVPVLVTNVSDNADYIKDNYNGYIIEPGSYQIMEDKILEIIESYNEKSGSIAMNAYQTSRMYFDYRLYTELLIGFFFPAH